MTLTEAIQELVKQYQSGLITQTEMAHKLVNAASLFLDGKKIWV